MTAAEDRQTAAVEELFLTRPVLAVALQPALPAAQIRRLFDDRHAAGGDPQRRLRASGQLPSLATLLTLDRAGFYGASIATYPQSAAFIRYLIDGENGALAEGFFTFLKKIAAGMRADLLKLLGRDVATLDEGFRRWLEAEERAGHEQMRRRAEQVMQSAAGGSARRR